MILAAPASRRALPWVLLLLLSACTYKRNVPDGVISCGGDAGDCPTDYRCVALQSGAHVCCRAGSCSDPERVDGAGQGGNEAGPPVRPDDGGDAGGVDGDDGGASGDPDKGICAKDACSPGAFRCVMGKLETCLNVEGCGTWGPGAACPDTQICAGASPNARCECPPPPAGCESGSGTRCESPTVALTCTTSEAKCLVVAQRATCPGGLACAGTFPSAQCSNCPAPPPECMRGTGRSCNAAGQLVECVTDPVTTCISLAAPKACDPGKICGGAFPDASCVCKALDAGQPCGKCGGVVKCDGTCSIPTPANHGQPCAECGGVVKCDGSCTVPNPPGYGQTCGNCGGVTKCDGSCTVPNPPSYGQACGSCGGMTRCDGSCSIPNPPNFGLTCNACGGTTKCDGSCSSTSTGGQPCGHCGGTLQCDNSCSAPDPVGLNQPCGSCGGMIKCDGTCSVPTPANYNKACGSCGGVTKCDGSCSIASPGNVGMNCGKCGGTTRCDGICSIATPATFGDSCNVCGTITCAGTCSRLTPCSLSDGLILHWKFDEDAMTLVAADSSPAHALPGNYVGGPTAFVPGAPLKLPSLRCRFFSTAQASQAVIVPGALPSALKPATAVTLATWYQASKIKPGNMGADLVSLGDNHILRLLPNGFEGTKRGRRGTGAEWIQCLSKPARTDHLDGRWHHLAVTISPTAITVYFDGVSVCQRASDVAMVYDVPGEFTVGRHGNREPTGNFDGLLDEVRVYARALAPAEIVSLAGGAN